MTDCAVIVFVKEPVPGRVKTRLAEAIGSEAASDAYRLMVETLMRNIGNIANLRIACSPATAQDSIAEWLGERLHYSTQSEGDLGNRMLYALSDALASGYHRAILIGSDCPDIDRADLEMAAEALGEHDVVLGPSNDGGYWLIGMKKPECALFRDIPWSTDEVLERTLQRCREQGLKVRLLSHKTDIDTVEEWVEFKKRRFVVKAPRESTD